MTALTVARSFPNFEREAARILAALVDHVHVADEARGVVKITADVPVDLFDRMAVWGSRFEDFEEDDPAEDNGDCEAENEV